MQILKYGDVHDIHRLEVSGNIERVSPRGPDRQSSYQRGLLTEGPLTRGVSPRVTFQVNRSFISASSGASLKSEEEGK